MFGPEHLRDGLDHITLDGISLASDLPLRILEYVWIHKNSLSKNLFKLLKHCENRNLLTQHEAEELLQHLLLPGWTIAIHYYQNGKIILPRSLQLI